MSGDPLYQKSFQILPSPTIIPAKENTQNSGWDRTNKPKLSSPKNKHTICAEVTWVEQMQTYGTWGNRQSLKGPWAIWDYAGLYSTIVFYCRPYKAIKYHTGPYWAVLDHLGPYRTIRDHTEPYRTIQDHKKPYKTTLNHTGVYGTICDHTGPYVTIGDHVGP